MGHRPVWKAGPRSGLITDRRSGSAAYSVLPDSGNSAFFHIHEIEEHLDVVPVSQSGVCFLIF